MRTKLDYSSLGEAKGTYSSTRRPATYSHIGKEVSGNVTHSSVREQRQHRSMSGPRASSYTRSTENSGTLGVAMGLLAGASVGVLAGILMAPDSGRITRRRLSDSAAWVGRGINEKLGVNKGKMDNWVDNAEETVSKAKDTVKNAMSDQGEASKRS